MSTNDTDMRDRPIGELVKELAGQTSTLVRQEIQLAQAEISTKGKLAGRGAGMLAGAAIAGLLALIALTAVLIAALDTADAAVAGGADRDGPVGRDRRGPRGPRPQGAAARRTPSTRTDR